MGHGPAWVAPPRCTPLRMSDIAQCGQTTVRITGLRRGFVDFDFILGDPQLSVELLMPAAEFQDFCQREGAAVTAASPTIDALRTSGAFLPEFLGALGSGKQKGHPHVA